MKRVIFCLVAVTAFGLQATAADYPHRTNLHMQSSASGMNQGSLPLLQREVGRGAATVSSILMDRFASPAVATTTAGRYSTAQDGTSIEFKGVSGWRLRVYNDGTAAEYANWPYRTEHLKAVPVEQRPSLDSLENWGRSFIRNHLADVVVWGPNEELVASHAMFEQEVVVTKAQSTRTVVGAFVVFSRLVAGSAIVGDGSKVVVHFTVDGTPWAFSYDWPTYSSTSTVQEMLPLAAIRERHSSLAPKVTTGSLVEERFECGYFDVGVRHRDPSALVQAGCVSHTVHSSIGNSALHAKNPDNGLIRSGRLIAIPAGVTVSPDGKWRELGAPNDGRAEPPKNTTDTNPKLGKSRQ